MYFALPNLHIRLCRGDTQNIILTLYEGERLTATKYVLKDNDNVYFGVMEPNSYFEEALIRKKFSIGDIIKHEKFKKLSKEDLDENNELVIKLHTTDTLTLLPGLYYYQIKLNRYNEELQDYEIHTLVKQTPFYIDP